ncbi:vitelline membrane outer layer protein 1 homolog isoform X2 [Ambystoma mexicanum]|uniref:vitelline membrane outer layer protein 1 homolog isoform X2 n=1 Tax=Ambystoma mexicanum TaxID=8296 RepID=UPI0037E72AB5
MSAEPPSFPYLPMLRLDSVPSFYTCHISAHCPRHFFLCQDPPNTSNAYFLAAATQMEEYQGKVDDTSVNGIRLYCTGTKYDKVHTVESGAGGWGHWMPTIWCPGVMLSFSLKVDPKHGKHGDDTAVNNIKFYCSSGIIIEGNGGKMGTYGPWSASCAKGICGIQTRVEGPQWLGDDTALNDAQLLCCNV